MRPRWRFNGSYRLTPRLQVGAEYNAAAGEWTPTANWIALAETERAPMLSFGTSSDRIFSPPHTQAYYATVAKGYGKFGPYVGVSYSEWEDRLLFPFGANIALSDRWDLLPMHDGRNTHLLLTHKFERMNVSLLVVKMRYPGVSIGFSF